ncbi:hypothetical protein, partial [Pseudomonas fluorescens]|uniref:hypothetical protein n=1 Tax=Pseudomonas fluorescens TaxID=294 RepID=UPI001F2B6829
MLRTFSGVLLVMAAVRGDLRVVRVSLFPGFPACVQLPPLRPETEWASFITQTEKNIMFKPTPNPPE